MIFQSREFSVVKFVLTCGQIFHQTQTSEAQNTDYCSAETLALTTPPPGGSALRHQSSAQPETHHLGPPRTLETGCVEPPSQIDEIASQKGKWSGSIGSNEPEHELLVDLNTPEHKLLGESNALEHELLVDLNVPDHGLPSDSNAPEQVLLVDSNAEDASPTQYTPRSSENSSQRSFACLCCPKRAQHRWAIR